MTETQGQPALKEIFDRARIAHFAERTAEIWPAFDRGAFTAHASAGLDGLGIMQRMRQVAAAYDRTLPADFGQAAAILRDVAPQIRHGFASIALCEVVVMRGRDDFEPAMEALRHLTQFGSAEYAIRPFLRDDFDRALGVMRGWAEDENEHVRRLASEGLRPRLPWSFRLERLVADPSPALPVLDALKADPSLYVRKSVANHLNDIGKDHPALLAEHVAGWDASDARTAWIVRHALRTLIKQGDPRALALIGASGGADVEVTRFTVEPARLRLGERLSIMAELRSTGDASQRIVADYAVHYVKKNGSASRKVFKLKEFELRPGETQALLIRQTIRDFTTRRHNAGFHKIELMVNGITVADGGFELVV